MIIDYESMLLIAGTIIGIFIGFVFTYLYMSSQNKPKAKYITDTPEPKAFNEIMRRGRKNE